MSDSKKFTIIKRAQIFRRPYGVAVRQGFTAEASRASRPPILIVTIATTVAMLPVFLIGALAPLLNAGIGLTNGELGIAIGAFFCLQAVSGLPSAWLVDWLGVSVCLLTAANGTAVVLLCAAHLAEGGSAIIVLAAGGGVFASLAQVAGNVALARTVSATRGALHFGVTQSAVPVASLLAGLCVPLLAAVAGWRAGFDVGALGAVAFVAAVAMRRRVARCASFAEDLSPLPAIASEPTERTKSMPMIAFAWMLGSAAVTAATEYLVSTSESIGLSARFGGATLALASGASVAVRMASGFASGRACAMLPWVAVMLSVGCVGSVVLAAANTNLLILLGGLLAIGVGSGWQGLFMYSYLRNKARAVRQSGIALASGGLGAAAGPTLFTLAWEHVRISFAWLAVAALYLAAAVLLLRATVKQSVPEKSIILDTQASAR